MTEIAVMSQLQCSLQFAALFDCVQDALVWVKDRGGRYCWVNRAFLINYDTDRTRREMGTGSDGVLGKTDYDLSPAFLADQYRLDDEQVLAGKRVVNRIERVSQPDGSTAWNVTNKVPLTGADGTVLGTAGITRRLDPPGQRAAPETEFGPVLAYLRDHYHEPITNEQLARLAHLSVRAFERKFRTSFQLTPQEYLRRLRMHVASRALVYTKQPLASLALQCGFVDQSHFSREFRRHFGRTPREYRAHYSLGSDAAAASTNSAAPEQALVLPPPLSCTL